MGSDLNLYIAQARFFYVVKCNETELTTRSMSLAFTVSGILKLDLQKCHLGFYVFLHGPQAVVVMC